jgi:hypothetical protein
MVNAPDDIVERILNALRPHDRAAAKVRLLWIIDRVEKLDVIYAVSMNKAKIRRSARQIDKAIDALQHELDSAPAALGNAMFGREPAERYSLLYNELARVHAVCAEQSQHPIGYGSRHSHMQQQCAYGAHLLMTELSALRITGYAYGPFKTIATMLYEAVSGEADVDLKSHCDFVLKHK